MLQVFLTLIFNYVIKFNLYYVAGIFNSVVDGEMDYKNKLR